MDHSRRSVLPFMWCLLAGTATAAAQPGGGEPSVVVFDVRSLVARYPAEGSTQRAGRVVPLDLHDDLLDHVVLAVRRFAGGALHGGDPIEPFGREALVARVDPAASASLRALLEHLEEERALARFVVSVDAYTASESTLPVAERFRAEETFLWPFESPDDPALKALRSAGKKHTSGYVTCHGVRPGSLLVGQNLAWIESHRAVRLVDGTTLDVPSVRESFEGFRFRLQMIDLGDRSLGVGLEAERHAIAKPVTVTNEDTPEGSRRVHRPEVSVVRIDSSAVLPASTRAVAFGRRHEAGWDVVVARIASRR